jgi:pimeloyl-ACP methyl ester carboxylesterase
VLAPIGDKLMTPELTRERVAAPIAGSRLIVVENASHYAIVEQPQRIAREIARFVGEL